MFEQDKDEEDINPFTMLLSGDENGDTKGQSTLHAGAGEPQLQQHYIRSIDSMLTIRQLPSQGLSFQLWPAATTLVNLLDDHRRDPIKSPLSPVLSVTSNGLDCRPLKILELGSGTGLVGIAAAVMLGANVTVTDLPHVISNLQFNADSNSDVLKANGGNVVVSALSWVEAGDVERVGREFDVILASDVVYHDHLYEPLLQTLYLLLGGRETTSFVMAHLRRWKKDSAFFKKAKKAFNVEVLYEDSPSEGSRVGVVVYRFWGKQIPLCLCFHGCPLSTQCSIFARSTHWSGYETSPHRPPTPPQLIIGSIGSLCIQNIFRMPDANLFVGVKEQFQG